MNAQSFWAPRALIFGAYGLMCAIWGTTWLGIKVSMEYLHPLQAAGLRFIIAGLLMFGFALAQHRMRPLHEVPWKLVLVLATFLFGLNYVLTYTAETHVSSGLTAVLFGVLPFFMFGLGHYLIRERTTPLTWLGATLAFGGVAVISLQADMHGSIWFALAAVGAALSSAFANVYAKRHAHHDALVTLPPSMLLAGIVVAAIGFSSEPLDVQRAFSAASWGALLYLAVAGSGIAFFLNMWLLQRIAAWKVGMSSLIIPVIAVAVGVLVGGEHFGARELLGAALVIAGVSVAMSKRSPA